MLDDSWFEEQRRRAEVGLQGVKLEGSMEVRFAVHDPLSRSQLELLVAARASQIETFGWPIGVVIESRDDFKPRPVGDGIRTEISVANDQFFGRPSYDYWALRKNGDFYLLQSLFEDMRSEGQIFFNTRMVRVAEALMFASRLYGNLGVPPDERISIRIVHRGLSGRTLSAVGSRVLLRSRRCIDAQSQAEIVAVLGAMKESLVEDVRHLLEPLFMLFEFHQIDHSIYEDVVRRFERGESS